MSVTVFFSYSHKDEALRDKLSEHLSILKRHQVIQDWHDRQIGAGAEWATEIDANLNAADIILLLISSSFLNSDYCWGNELQQAMQRHEAGEACVIPVILRPVDWQGAPFGKLQAFPKDARPVTLWENEDAALMNVAQGIRVAVEKIAQHKKASVPLELRSMVIAPLSKPPVMERLLIEDNLSSEKGIDYKPLRDMLKAGKWQEADRETLRVMCVAMERQTEGWLREKDVQQFPRQDLRTIDQLWVEYSEGKFGFSVQKQIWQECGKPTTYNGNWEKFGDLVGWRVKKQWITYLEDGVTFNTSTPKGHLPWVFFVGFVGWRGLMVRWVGFGVNSLLSRRDL
ncbi:GUN4 domain-containing protein [Phormidesmis sp. 146-33]